MTSPRPFKIQIFVAEGVPEGLRIVEKSNWIGQGVICPRSQYPRLKIRDEFGQSGVYILIGRDEEGDRPMLYVGEAEVIRKRLDSHHLEKDFWTQVIVFTTKGDPLHKAQVQYLEARLVELATRHRRCRLDNRNAPKRPGLSEADKAEIESFLLEMLSLLPVLGVLAFEAVRVPRVQAGEAQASKPDAVSQIATSDVDPNRIYNLVGPACEARGFPASDGFAVLEGSRARVEGVPSLERHVPGVVKRRQALETEGLLQVDGDSFVLQADTVFSSPSTAAAVFLGRNSNGWVDWVDDEGRTLDDNRKSDLEQ